MNTLKHAIFVALTGLFALSLCLAQTKGPEEIKVPLTDPSQPAFLKINLLNGSILVKGYAGKEVIVQSRPMDGELNTDRDEDRETDAEKIAKRRGMRRLTNTGGGLTIEEDHNEVTIGTGWRSMGTSLELSVQVPLNSSMKLSTINDGEISVTHINGDIEVSNLNGPVTLSDISGSVVADALNSDIRVVFSGIDAKKAMSFSSMNGDIDVTLPAGAKSTLKLKNEMGEIYSDFDMNIDTSPTRIEENRKDKRGRYRLKLEKVMTGTINGGGTEMTFKNFNGDIYIRKGK